MRLLLDNCALLWALGAPGRLGPRARAAIEPADEARVSVASFWENAIKAGLGKIDGDVDALIPEAERAGIGRLAIEPAHLSRLNRLPPLHRDPFDRMLAAQAQAEGLALVTADAALGAYAIERIGARA